MQKAAILQTMLNMMNGSEANPDLKPQPQIQI
jgi:hypothetical protein